MTAPRLASSTFAPAPAAAIPAAPSASPPKSSTWLFASETAATPAAESASTAAGGPRKKNGLRATRPVRLPRSDTQHSRLQTTASQVASSSSSSSDQIRSGAPSASRSATLRPSITSPSSPIVALIAPARRESPCGRGPTPGPTEPRSFRGEAVGAVELHEVRPGHVGAPLEPVRAALERGHPLLPAGTERLYEPSPGHQLLDERRRDLGEGRGDHDSVERRALGHAPAAVANQHLHGVRSVVLEVAPRGRGHVREALDADDLGGELGQQRGLEPVARAHFQDAL